MNFQKSINLANKLSNIVISRNQGSLAQYDASFYILEMLNIKSDFYSEFPIRDPNTLGISFFKHNYGLNVLINKNIENKNRKLFTQAHELAHVLLHEGILKSKNYFSDNNENISDYESNKLEAEANIFAAYILLPNIVLESQLLENFSYGKIKKISKVSKQTIKWRIVSLLQTYIEISNKHAEKIANEYISSYDDLENTTLIKFISISSPLSYRTVRHNNELNGNSRELRFKLLSDIENNIL